jgi:hypothetical protein
MAARFLLATFRQADLLRNETDPEVRRGVCVALCDIWLESFLKKPLVDPIHRMAFLATSIEDAKAHQKVYGELRDKHGREDARRSVGKDRDIDYDPQTTISRLSVGMDGIRAKLSADLTPAGAAGTWSMRFEPEGGHAIAGVNRPQAMRNNMNQLYAHVFDPNIGEYVGPLSILPAILTDLFQKFPLYAKTAEMDRTTARRLT